MLSCIGAIGYDEMFNLRVILETLIEEHFGYLKGLLGDLERRQLIQQSVIGQKIKTKIEVAI